MSSRGGTSTRPSGRWGKGTPRGGWTSSRTCKVTWGGREIGVINSVQIWVAGIGWNLVMRLIKTYLKVLSDCIWDISESLSDYGRDISAIVSDLRHICDCEWLETYLRVSEAISATRDTIEINNTTIFYRASFHTDFVKFSNKIWHFTPIMKWCYFF